MGMSDSVLAIDQGTTSSRASAFDHAGRPVSSGQLEHEQILPRAGWVEHDPQEIWRNVREVSGLAMSRGDIARGDIVAVGITNQRETTVVWDRHTGEPVYNEIGRASCRERRRLARSARTDKERSRHAR